MYPALNLKFSPSPPLVIVVLFFIPGIIFSYFCPLNLISLAISVLILLSLALLSLKKKLLSGFFLFGAIFSLGAFSYQNAKILPPNNISGFITQGRNQVWLKAELCSQIDTAYTSTRKKKSSFVLKILAIENKGAWQPVRGKVKATLFMEEPGIGFGDILVLRGEILEAKNTSEKDAFDYRQYLARQGIYGLLVVKPDSTNIIKESKHPLKLILSLKEKFRRIIDKTLSYPHQAILSALILGDRQEIPKIIKDNFIKTGTVHILAISGLHVGLISYIFYLFLKILRIPRQLSYFMLIFLITAYAILTGGRSPVVRATIMAVVYLEGLILRRQTSILNSLALSCLIILICSPQQLFDAGFQLSFLSVLAIIILTPLLENWFKYRTSGILPEKERRALFWDKTKRYMTKSIIVSFSAWLGIVPIVGCYFKIITPVAILANLLVIPLSFLVLAIGFISLLSGLFSPGLANIFSHTNFVAIGFLIKSAALLAKIPGGTIDTQIFSLPLILIYYFILGAFYLLLKR